MKRWMMPRRQGGQSLIETVIAIPVFGAVLLGIFQAVLFYRAKAVVDYAALQAARRGATHFADKGAICKGFAAGMTPLYTHDPSSAGALVGYEMAQLNICGMRGATIDIISPTRAMFDAWKEKQFDGVEAIPNDSLMFRGSDKKAGVTVQDANLLKIRVTYKFPLIVPVIDKIISDSHTVRCTEHGCRTFKSLKIVSQAIVRMQTPIRDRSVLASAHPPAPGGTGGGGGTGPLPPAGGPIDWQPGGGGTGGDGGDGGNVGGGSPPKHVCT